DLSTVAVLEAVGIDPLPPGTSTLIESDQGPLAFTVPREGFSDTVITFALWDGTTFNTNWFRSISFPLFLFNCLVNLGNAEEALGNELHAPGQPVVLRIDTQDDTVTLTGPDGRTSTLQRNSQGMFVAQDPALTGVYSARWSPNGLLPFAVNLFDDRESDLAPRGLVPEGVPPSQADRYKIKIGYNPVTGTARPH